MTISSNGTQAGTGQAEAHTGEESSTQPENIQGESVSTENMNNTTNTASKLATEDTAKKEVTGTLAISGSRPIGSSDLDVAQTMMVSGERPISSSNLQIVETVNIMGIRPIAANKMQVSDTINLSGIRPIAKSGLVVSETYSIMGNRPVASNEIDDSFSLMGFLD